MELKNIIKQSFETATSLLSDFSNNNSNLNNILILAQHIVGVFENGHKIIICGNGGSACDAMHFAEEFTGRFRKNRRALPVISLSDSSHITCVGNDYGFEYVFSRGVEAYGQSGDLFIGLSTSGRSKNIVNAFTQAQQQHLSTCMLLGGDGGMLAGQADFEWIIPASTSDRVQELHMLILHSLIETVERIMFKENYRD